MSISATATKFLNDATPEYFAELGKLTFYYARLESNLRTTVGVLIFLKDSTSNLVDAIFGNAGVNQIIESIERLYHTRLEFKTPSLDPKFASKLADKFKAAIDLSRKAQAQRNVFAHSTWTRDANDWIDFGNGWKVPVHEPTNYVLMRSKLTRNPTKPAEAVVASVEELTETVETIHAAIKAVVEFKGYFALVYVMASMSPAEMLKELKGVQFTSQQLAEFKIRDGHVNTPDENEVLELLAQQVEQENAKSPC